MINPFAVPVPLTGRGKLCDARRALGPIIKDHFPEFDKAMEGRFAAASPERYRGHAMLRSAIAAYEQASYVANAVVQRSNPMAAAAGLAFAAEAPLASSTLQAQVTDFITQMIHVSLEVYPRLIASRLTSLQPFTQPSGYVFYMRRLAKDDGPTTSGTAGRSLADLDTHDPEYSLWENEGDQIRAVGMELTKDLVEVEWRALMHQFSHQVDVALRSQHSMDILTIGDMITADELAWEVDRTVVDRLVTFAGTNTRGDVYWDPDDGGSYSTYAPSEQAAYDRRLLEVAITAIQVEMAHDIFRQPNWAVVGTNVAKQIAKTPMAFGLKVSDQMFDQRRMSGNILQMGTSIDGVLYLHDPQIDPNLALFGHVDNMNPFYAGAIFSPFGLASVLTAAFQDPDTLLTKKSRALAFAFKGVRPQQFRILRLGAGS